MPVIATRSIDKLNSRVNKKVLIQFKNDSSVIKEYIESVHFFTKGKIEKMLNSVGFKDIYFYGSSDGESFGAESKRMLIICRKP